MAAIDWTPVEEAEQERTLTGYKVALLEAAKILDERLQEERVPGKTYAERLESAKLHLTRPNDVTKASAYVEGLRGGVTGGLTKERAKTYLQTFRQAVADMNELSQVRDSFIGQAKLYIGLLRGKQRWLLRALIGLGAFFFGVLFLAHTTPGEILVTGVVGLVDLFFGVIVGILLALGVLLAVILGTAIYLSRQGGRVRGEDEE